jgi:hypothetical protein
MPQAAHARDDTVVWFQCRECRRMWSSDQRPPSLTRRLNDNSPESN